jgi:hypothetical protein
MGANNRASGYAGKDFDVPQHIELRHAGQDADVKKRRAKTTPREGEANLADRRSADGTWGVAEDYP